MPSRASLSIVVLSALAACGGDDSGPLPLSVEAQRKRQCAANAQFSCANDAQWSADELSSFGTADYPIGADGCMRVACKTDLDCAASETCFMPGCYPVHVSCQNEALANGIKVCSCTSDPACGGSYCSSR